MKFELGTRFDTDKRTVEVDPLPPGTYRFRLVVQNRKGQSSLPVEHDVTVQQLRSPRRFVPVEHRPKAKPAKRKPTKAKPAKPKPTKPKPTKPKPPTRGRKPRTPPP